MCVFFPSVLTLHNHELQYTASTICQVLDKLSNLIFSQITSNYNYLGDEVKERERVNTKSDILFALIHFSG